MRLKTNWSGSYTNRSGQKRSVQLKSAKGRSIQVVRGFKTNGRKLYRVQITKTTGSASNPFGLNTAMKNTSAKNLKNGGRLTTFKRKGKQVTWYRKRKSNGKYHHVLTTTKTTGRKSAFRSAGMSRW